MKLLRITLLSITCVCHLQAVLEQKVEQVNPDRTDAVRQVWYRDGVRILSQQTMDEEAGTSMSTIYPEGEKAWSIVLFFTRERISGLSTLRPLQENRISIDDFTRDGIPDLIQVIRGEEGKVEHIEAFSIVDGILEPIPESFYEGRTHEFYYDEEIVTYLKAKIEPAPTS
ncbi:hypothetical protein DDZ13_13010 [Coraliomargarita sinensis]|uniref:Uncharacterized protein n=1 Tax=Coraliomargarita sinensis TaxID=2174842 RepID=A0A317ZDM7_9BACT|nr:hypothetical protein [Coraliomargarita sinensis]PXA03336.1 hypothetical protein DDZ13_13010 [Coraliomargarita sinensis]